MRRLRRSPIHPRIELIPLIDVMTFLLTYFIYATATLMRVDIVPMHLRQYSSGKSATPAPALTISMDLQGQTFVDREKVPIEDITARVKKRIDADRKTVVYLAIADGEGTVDRAPKLTDLWDRLRTLNITVNLVGRPGMAPRAVPSGDSGASSPPDTP
jgi:biopolymer transport protein ExbD